MARKSRRGRVPTPARAPAQAPLPAPALERNVLWSLGISIGLLVLVALIYSPVRHYAFVPLDDPVYVSENPHVLGGLTWQNVSWAFTSRWASYWIPLTWVSYMLDVRMFGVDPGVFHLTNVWLHAANTLLLFFFLRRETRAMWRSACVAALFAVHPLHVESVAWITERKDVLSTCFLLLALIAYAAYTRQRTPGRYLTVCGLFIAGLLAKPMLVTLPFLLILCDVWPIERVTLDVRTRDARARLWTVVWEKWPLMAIAAGASAIAVVTQDRGGAMAAMDVFPPGLRAANALVSYILYLWQTLWPAHLVVLYTYPGSIPVWQVAGAVVLLAAISFVTFRRATKQPFLAMGWLWYLGTLIPVIGFVQVGLQPRADRFTYVPLVGVFIAVVWGANELIARSRTRTIALAVTGAAVTLACTVASRQQVAYWQDGVTLWGHTVEVLQHTDAAQAQYELGTVLMNQGRTTEAIAHFTESIRAKPAFPGAHAALGVVLARDGRPDEAKAEYAEALRLDPAMAEIHNNLGVILATEGRIADAVPHFQDAVRLKPDFELADVNLGVALMRLGRRDEAIRALSLALQLNPGNAQARHVLDLLTKPKG